VRVAVLKQRLRRGREVWRRVGFVEDIMVRDLRKEMEGTLPSGSASWRAMRQAYLHIVKQLFVQSDVITLADIEIVRCDCCTFSCLLQ
jgi:hypothetical protein